MRTFAIVLLLIFTAPVIKAQEPGPEKPFQYVGHRGASYLAPENTLASIQLAWRLGADAAECDVMLTADGKVVLFHDKNTKKLTGKSFTVKDATWEELKHLVVIPRETNLPEYDQETIPLLKDVLDVIPEDRMLVIEIKTGPEILPYLQELIAEHWKSGRISLIAFDFETIRQSKELYPEVPCYYLSMFKPDFNKHFEAVVESRLDGVDLRHTIIDRPLMEKCLAAGLDVWCWTVNDPETARKMQQLGVSAVTTDRPAWLKSNLQE
ncbi:MAG: glycerophosphodiester phosphodiesterase family protein [Bacteroidales bacterium]|nr:glycerophosphodiester phosphodiesterase family protein [Bacteroidales bacterium]